MTHLSFSLRLPVAALATLAGLLTAMLPAQAQTHPAAAYPAKPIRLVAPFTPGGSTDILARAIGQELSRAWGQSVVIDNVPGAGGSIGADKVAKARPGQLNYGSGGNGSAANLATEYFRQLAAAHPLPRHGAGHDRLDGWTDPGAVHRRAGRAGADQDRPVACPGGVFADTA